MSETFKLEWIPNLLDAILSNCTLEDEIMSDIKSAQALLVKKNLKIQKKKKKKKKKRKNPPPFVVTVDVCGKLPHCLMSDAFRAAVVPMFEDLFSGKVVYHGFNRMNNGTPVLVQYIFGNILMWAIGN